MVISLYKSITYSSISAFLASYYSAVVSFLCVLLLPLLPLPAEAEAETESNVSGNGFVTLQTSQGLNTQKVEEKTNCV